MRLKGLVCQTNGFYIRLTVTAELRPEFTFLFSDFDAQLDRGSDASTNIKTKQKKES